MTSAPSPAGAKPNWTTFHTFSLFLIGILIVGVGLLIPFSLLWTWLAILVLLGVFTAIAGAGVTGLWTGALIDETNKMSLSRLQILLWTVLVLSAFVAVALANLRAGQASPLAIAIPQQIWVVLGISTTSLIGTPLIRSQKMNPAPRADQRDLTLEILRKERRARAEPLVWGVILVNARPEDAEWSDLFRGEETGNGAHLDVGKIQLFYFTLILVLVYAVALGSSFLGSLPIHQFPELDQSAIALLAISHGGYLSNQVVPHSATA